MVPAVVALRVSGTRAFDTDPASVAPRHGLRRRRRARPDPHQPPRRAAGPVTAEADVPRPRDGSRATRSTATRSTTSASSATTRSAVRFMRPAEIRLAPERARVGSEVRVVGNDAGEKLSILSGHPRAPRPRRADLRRERLQRLQHLLLPGGLEHLRRLVGLAGASTSPGRRVALNAGGSRNASSSFFLPLDRVVRALALLRAGKPVPARHAPGRCSATPPSTSSAGSGLRRETEAAVRRRFPDGTGLLVVDEVVPAGPADGALEPGDVLLAVGGRPAPRLRDARGRCSTTPSGRASRSRSSGAASPERPVVPVQDLHAITPAAYLEFGGGVLHPLSFQQARNHAVPVARRLRRLAGLRPRPRRRPGRRRRDGGRRRGRSPTSTPSRRASRRRPTARASRVRWFALDRPANARSSRCSRSTGAGTRCSAAPGTTPRAAGRAAPRPRRPPRRRPAPATTSFDGVGPARAARPRAVARVRRVRRALQDRRRPRPRLLGQRARGRRRARARRRRPRHRAGLPRRRAPHLRALAQRAGARGRAPPRARARGRGLRPGAARRHAGAERRASRRSRWLRETSSCSWASIPPQRLVSRRTEVARIEEQAVPLPEPPRFREANLELVFTDRVRRRRWAACSPTGRGRVRALWSSISKDVRGGADAFFAGVPIDLLEEMVAPLRAGQPLRWRSLGVELGDRRRSPTPPSAASRRRRRRASRRTIRERRRAVEVTRVAAGTPASGAARARRPAARRGRRAGDELPRGRARGAARGGRARRCCATARSCTLRVATLELDPIGTRRALLWARRAAPAAARTRCSSSAACRPRASTWSGRWYGSPVERHGLRATRRILAVSGAPTPDLDAFLAAVRERARPRLGAAPRRGPRRQARGADPGARPPLLADAGAALRGRGLGAARALVRVLDPQPRARRHELAGEHPALGELGRA